MVFIDLTGRVVVLTGAMGFLGQHFTCRLREAGATVVTTDTANGADILMDVTSADSISKAFREIIRRHGSVNCVINNAAFNPRVDDPNQPYAHQFENYPDTAMLHSITVNQIGTWNVCKAAVKFFRSSDTPGVIVNVASIYGVVPPRQEIYAQGTEKAADYSMTKAAVVMLTRHMASQFGRDGIRVNCLAPGGVFNNQDEAFVKRYSAMTSFGRMSQAEEVADSLLFLVSDLSRGMTGETLSVDCGVASR